MLQHLIIIWQLAIMHCLGCGAIPGPTERRSLTAPDFIKLFVENEELGEGVDIDKILNGEDSQRPPKICLKCFRAYHQNIQANIRKVFRYVSSSQSDSQSQSQQIPVSFCADSQHTGNFPLSPDVASLIFNHALY